MTREEYNSIVQVHGRGFSYLDIPTYIRRRDEGKEYHLPDSPSVPDKYQEWAERQLTSGKQLTS